MIRQVLSFWSVRVSTWRYLPLRPVRRTRVSPDNYQYACTALCAAAAGSDRWEETTEASTR